MSEKTLVDQGKEGEKTNGSPRPLPKYQYSRDELYDIKNNSLAAQARPDILEKAFDAEEGKWDPDRWYKSKFGSRESSPLTLTDGKDRRRLLELDRDSKRRPSLNDTVERLKESERDGIVLSPQRRSFIAGCQVVQPSFSRQHSITDADREREESRGERERERERDRDRERDRPVRKVGSGRIQIDRENSRDYSGLRDRHDDRESGGDRDRGDRDLAWNRDRYDNRNRGEREWDRERDNRDFRDSANWDRDRDRDRRYERSDRFQRPNERDFPGRDNRRDRDFRDRGDRGFDNRSGRRRHYHEEKEPEWFTGGPTSQNDTIELRGFEKIGEPENENRTSVNQSNKNEENEKRGRNSVEGERASKDSGGSEDVAEADGVQSQCSSPEDDQEQMLEAPHSNHKIPSPQQLLQGTSFPGNTLLDFDQILKASLPLEEEKIGQGESRFSQFFTRSENKSGFDPSGHEDMHVPRDLLDEHPSPTQSPGVIVTPQGLMHPHHLQHIQGQHHLHILQQQQQQQQYLHHLQQLSEQQDAGGQFKASSPLPSAYPAYVPNSAGDNQGGPSDKAALTPSVTALFNTAAVAGGSSASLSSNSSFSAQDASAQLKAMLFGGAKDSAPTSGTASPLPTSVHHRQAVKTVAELEADMHQNSTRRKENSAPSAGNAHQAGDMSAFNKLLTMVKAASETNQTVVSSDPSGHSAHGIMPGNSEFNHALMRNKEQQLQLLHQSIQNAPKAPQQQVISEPPPIIDPAVMQQKSSVPLHYQKFQNMPAVFSQQPPLHLSAPSPIHPGQMSPHSMTIGGNLTSNTIPSPSGMRSPIPRVPSPQELSAHNQSVVYNAFVKKQLQDQADRAMKKQRERVQSPHEFINIVKPPPAAQLVLPPNPQPKGAALDTFTPTSVLRKMHSDKAAEKEKQTHGCRFENEQDFMPSVQELSDDGMKDNFTDKLDLKSGLDDLNDISFLDPVNPNLVPLSNQMDSSLRIGQSNVLPGSLSQPMSVEEKLKLSMLAAKPGNLSQMLDKSKAAAEASRSSSHGRPIVKAPFSEQLPEDQDVLQQHFPHMFQPQQTYHVSSGGRPVTGSGGIATSNVSGGQRVALPPFSSGTSVATNPAAKSGAGGRAIVGSSSVHQQSSPHSAANLDITRLMEQQMLRVSQPPHSQTGVVLPHPSLAILGPPPVGMPIAGHMMAAPMNSAVHQQYARAHAQHNQHLSMMSMQQGGMAPLRTMVPAGPVSAPLSPPNSGTLSQAALSATIQKVASPHSALFNCQQPPVSTMNGSGGKIDVNTGIQRWFSPDILRTQLPSMPPLPTHGNHVMTVDELERN